MNDLIDNFQHVRKLATNIRSRIDVTKSEDVELLNELAGMYAVTIVATYEGIVKTTLIDYAAKFHAKYKSHIEHDFHRLNARISIDDLKAYSKRFGLSEWTDSTAPRNATVV